MHEYEPKALMWKRFCVTAVLPSTQSKEVQDWLWENNKPDLRKRMRVTHASVYASDEEGVDELVVMIEYAARGANGHDVRRKVWQAMTVVSERHGVQLHAKVEARCMASVWLNFTDYVHNDAQWLEDKIYAAGQVADEIQAAADDWSDIEEETTQAS